LSGPRTPGRVAVAGASGFVGRRLCARLRDRGFAVTALGRSVPDGVDLDGVRWHRADLFNLKDCERALAGVEVVYYLVHSMLPSSGLTQASFEDMDLILADNVARAAARGGARRIVYLGGLVPEGTALSRHLESRREVEGALGAHGVPVTTLRAGLVIGPEGSSFRILERLVRRLPSMVLPRWTRERTQPIALDDVVELLVRVVEQDAAVGEAIDVGGPDIVSYRALIERTARALGRNPSLWDVPVGNPTLSELWVSGVTGQPRQLTGPLIESLAHSMVARDRAAQLALGVDGVGVDEALRRAVAGESALPDLRVPRGEPSEPPGPVVRSVQRMRLPSGRDTTWAAREYLDWLPQFLWPVVRVRPLEGGRYQLRALGLTLLELTWSPERSTPSRALLYVTGGQLARLDGPRPGRLELRAVDQGRVLLAAIHDFAPRLPWLLYLLTQAPAHLAVMAGFRRHLARLVPQARAAVAPGR
jgi:uncharacterized protein YbjT (DUF2867 family)